jgi:hypothetical protein
MRVHQRSTFSEIRKPSRSTNRKRFEPRRKGDTEGSSFGAKEGFGKLGGIFF